MNATTIQSDSHQFCVLYAGASEGVDFYAVFRVEKGNVRQASSWMRDTHKANEIAREWAERDGVQWFGR